MISTTFYKDLTSNFKIKKKLEPDGRNKLSLSLRNMNQIFFEKVVVYFIRIVRRGVCGNLKCLTNQKTTNDRM